MRRLFLCCIASLPLLLTVGSTQAQDPNKIIDQYLKAAGGSKALSKITTLSIEGSFTGDVEGTSGTYTFDLRAPNRYYSELNVISAPGETAGASGSSSSKPGEQHFIAAYNGKSAWREDSSGNTATLLGADGQQVEVAAEYYNSRLIDLKKRKIGVAFVGHSQWGAREILQLELTWPSGMKREVYFDTQTHLIAKESAPLAGSNEEILYDDYRNVDGVKLPFKIELHRGNQKYTIAVSKAAINDKVTERVFDFPRNVQVQLPDLKALFKEIDQNQKAIDKIKENYAGTRDEEETEFEGSGKVKKVTTNEYTFFYMYGDEISTLVKKDGKALSESEQKRENEKAQKAIEEAQKQEAKKEAKDAKAKEERQQEKDDPDIETFLRACQFVNPRRERFRGQDVLVFDFEPNVEFKPHKMVEDLVHKLAGVIWIDEKAHDVVRLEAYFVGDFKIAGGLLANLQKGTSFIFEQAYVNNEVWLPTYEEAHVGVRLLLVKGFKMNEVTRYSDYRKFNTSVVPTVAPPKQ
ncbi:MAG TPA: hypothetical protein VKR82_05865 [Candidatus Acidoferrales bacterium]|nr:hypothetical protein [Candidatus Acidoferrales bacterium]